MGYEDDREAALRVHRELNSLAPRRTRQPRQVPPSSQPSPPKKQSATRICLAYLRWVRFQSKLLNPGLSRSR
jgi:hypothetical protein